MVSPLKNCGVLPEPPAKPQTPPQVTYMGGVKESLIGILEACPVTSTRPLPPTMRRRGLAGDTDWLYWPVPYEVVEINISKRIFDRGIADGGVTESEILWAISHDPDKLFAFRPNKENLDADGKFGTYIRSYTVMREDRCSTLEKVGCLLRGTSPSPISSMAILRKPLLWCLFLA